MCAHSQTNKLQKRPPSAFRNAFSAPRESLNVLRQRGAESRTMAFARHVGVADHGTETDRPRTDGATRWTPSSSSSSPRVSTWGLVEEKIAPAQSEPGPASRDVVPYLSNEHAVPPPRSRLADYSLSFFQQSLAYSSWAVAHPVSAVEHQWAVRATRAEALLDAHTVHRQEVLTLEERRSVGLSLNSADAHANQISTARTSGAQRAACASVRAAATDGGELHYKRTRPCPEV